MVPINSSTLAFQAHVASEQSLFKLTNRSRVAFLKWQATQPDDDATHADAPGACSFSAVITICHAKQCVNMCDILADAFIYSLCLRSGQISNMRAIGRSLGFLSEA